MGKTGKYVTVIAERVVNTHFPDVSGNYATLCGMDGNDPDPTTDQITIETPRGAKVDCDRCISIFDLIHEYGERDIDRTKDGEA